MDFKVRIKKHKHLKELIKKEYDILLKEALNVAAETAEMDDLDQRLRDRGFNAPRPKRIEKQKRKEKLERDD